MIFNVECVVGFCLNIIFILFFIFFNKIIFFLMIELCKYIIEVFVKLNIKKVLLIYKLYC